MLPHAGWHEQRPQDLVGCMVECMTKCIEKLEFVGYTKESVKGIGEFPFLGFLLLSG